MMLQVDQSLLIGTGHTRIAYLHPDDPSKILKLHQPGHSPREIRQGKKFRQLVPLSHFDANNRDYIVHTKARAKSPELHPHICEIFGFVETNLGLAIMAEHITNFDGTTSLTMAQHVQSSDEDIYGPLRELFALLAKHHACYRDPNIGNVMVRRKQTGFELVIVDGMGEANLIPYATYSKSLNRKKLHRKVERLVSRLKNLPAEI